MAAMHIKGYVAGFRAFAIGVSQRGEGPESLGYLSSLTGGHDWVPGPQEADEIPTIDNTHGFYAFKTFAEAVYQAGQIDEFVFALTAHWGRVVEAETGIRSQHAQICAFIEPTRAAAKSVFPYERLATIYPDVSMIHQRRISEAIEYYGLTPLARAQSYPVMQWLTDQGLVWAPEVEGAVIQDPSDEYPPVMLEPASIYPDEMHPVDQRLIKSRVQTLAGDDATSYVIWTLLGEDSSAHVREALNLITYGGESGMYRHRVEAPLDPLDVDEGE